MNRTYHFIKVLKGDKPETARKLAKVLDYAAMKPLQFSDAAALLGVTESGGRLYLNTLYAQQRVHVSGWAGMGATALPLFSAGAGTDVARPPYVAKRRNRRAIDRARDEARVAEVTQSLVNWVPHRDPMVAAFFGSRA